jgi:hypothetical protein
MPPGPLADSEFFLFNAVSETAEAAFDLGLILYENHSLRDQGIRGKFPQPFSDVLYVSVVSPQKCDFS